MPGLRPRPVPRCTGSSPPKCLFRRTPPPHPPPASPPRRSAPSRRTRSGRARGSSARRACRPDADPQPRKLVRAELLDDRLQPVVAAGRSARRATAAVPAADPHRRTMTSRSDGATLWNAASSRTAHPLRFMNVVGLASKHAIADVRHLRRPRLPLRRDFSTPRDSAAPALRPPETRRCAACPRTRGRDCRDQRSASRNLIPSP